MDRTRILVIPAPLIPVFNRLYCTNTLNTAKNFRPNPCHYMNTNPTGRKFRQISMKPTLLILAAGVSSRYGGLKQIDPVARMAKPSLITRSSTRYALGLAGSSLSSVVTSKRHSGESSASDSRNGFSSRHMFFNTSTCCRRDIPVPASRKKPWGTGTRSSRLRAPFLNPLASSTRMISMGQVPSAY